MKIKLLNQKFKEAAMVPDLLKSVKRAIEVIDRHISDNPTAITQLPELRHYLANCVDRCVHYLNLNRTKF